MDGDLTLPTLVRIAMPSTVSSSPLRALEDAFAALASGVAALSFQDQPLGLVRQELLRAGTPRAFQDMVWTFLVAQARSGDPRWILAAIGAAVPGLSRHARQLSSWRPQQAQDIEAELIRGFLEALARVDVGRPAIAGRLIDAARRDAARRCLPVQHEQPDADPGRWPDRHVVGHPDLLLVDAVAAGVITAQDGRLLAATRLERAPDEQVAAALGMSVTALRSRRHRAARRLADAIVAGTL
jgi:hypothetical protein